MRPRLSRLYGGIHFRFAIESGLDQGRCIGAYAAALKTEDLMRALSCCWPLPRPLPCAEPVIPAFVDETATAGIDHGL